MKAIQYKNGVMIGHEYGESEKSPIDVDCHVLQGVSVMSQPIRWSCTKFGIVSELDNISREDAREKLIAEIDKALDYLYAEPTIPMTPQID